jgi:hypothetical protein
MGQTLEEGLKEDKAVQRSENFKNLTINVDFTEEANQSLNPENEHGADG